jgi:hypothetical protein
MRVQTCPYQDELICEYQKRLNERGPLAVTSFWLGQECQVDSMDNFEQ